MDVTFYGCEPDEAALVRERAPYFGITPVITASPVTDHSVHLARGSRCISVGHKASLTASLLTALSDVGVRYISTRSAGVDHIDVGTARDLGITVENTDYSVAAVAEHAVMLILMALRQAGDLVRRVAASDFRPPPTRGRELRDLTVGVVGTGRIGSAVVDRLRGFGCGILTHDPRDGASAGHVAFDELLRRCDVVTLHVPLDAGTRHLIDRPSLERMRAGAYLVNTARGGLVDSAALADALEQGSLAGAALDVVEDEDGIFYSDRRSQGLDDGPLRRLQRLPGVVLTPHSAYYTDHALADTVVNGLINCLRFERGLRHD